MLEYAAPVGIDWADAKHDVCLIDCASGRREAAIIKHTPEEIDQWADSLRGRYPGQQVAVCLEQARGPLIYASLKYDFLTLYPINPKTLAKFRGAFTPSRAKDDPGDAAYLVDLLALRRDKLKAWLPGDEETRTLQYLVEHRRRLVDDRSRISNRLTSLLKGYFLKSLTGSPTSARSWWLSSCSGGPRSGRSSGCTTRPSGGSSARTTLYASMSLICGSGVSDRAPRS